MLVKAQNYFNYLYKQRQREQTSVRKKNERKLFYSYLYETLKYIGHQKSVSVVVVFILKFFGVRVTQKQK